MELNTTNLCNGCSSQDRKITNIRHTSVEHCFFMIIHEFEALPNELENVYLCWECEARVRNFVKFKEQVKRSYSILKDRAEVLPQSSLSIQNVCNIIDVNHATLTEPDDEILIKNEVHSNTENLDDSDVNHATLTEPDDEILIKNDVHSNTENLDDSDVNHATLTEPDDEILIKNDVHSNTENLDDSDVNHATLTEPDDEILIKNEVHSNTENLDDSDDISLINYSEKEKDKTNKKKKLKKIKKVKIDLKNVRRVRLKSAEVHEERRKMENSQDYVNAMFRCERCIISFPNEDDLKEHVQKKHELHASKYKCKICECSFSSEVSLKYHQSSSHMVRYQCKICGEKTQNKRAATKHHDTVHCYGETYELESREESKTETAEQNGENKSYSCEFCDKVFRWKTSLRKHVEMHQIEAGQKRRPYCEPCGLTFTTTSNLQRHAKTSSKHQINLKLRKLKDTNTETKMKALLEDIKDSILSTKELFSCPQCDKKFEWRGNMLRHLNTHVTKAKGELVCKPCNRTFSSKATYKQHLQISKKHVTENDFKYMCSDCGKRYPNKWKLKEHVNWEHLKNYVYSCSDCQKVFSCNTSLYLHRQMVHKPNEYLCDLCGKSFPNKTKLQSHISALHSKDAPYKCKCCSARFNWQSCLSRHERRLHNKHSSS